MEQMKCNYYDSSLCRVCIKCDPTIQQTGATIFDRTEDVSIYERLNTICDVDIKPEDGLPDRICVECLLELHNAVRFKQKCESSNKVLLSAASTNSQSAVKEEAKDVKLEEDHYTDHEFLDEDVQENKEPHSPPDNYVKQEHEKEQEDEGIQPEQQQQENEEPHSPSDNYVKQEHEKEQEDEGIQPNTERPSRSIDLKLECHDCGWIFKSKCKLKVHWNKEHLQQYLTCDKCKRLFCTYKAFNNHKQKDSELCSNIEVIFRIEGTGRFSKFFCKQCEYSTSDRSGVKHHVRKHNGEKRHQCDLCPMSFFQVGSLHCHKETHHQIYRREGPCDICGVYIKGLFNYRAHMNRRHKNKGDVICDICHKVYKNKKYLVYHMDKHTGKKHSCNMCPKQFSTITNLYTHKRQVHGKKSYDMCPICGYSIVKGSTRMKVHIAKHEKYNYICTVCGRFFENDVQLKLHKLRHDERNYKCTQCDKTYFSRRCLVKHVHDVHKKLK